MLKLQKKTDLVPYKNNSHTQNNNKKKSISVSQQSPRVQGQPGTLKNKGQTY